MESRACNQTRFGASDGGVRDLLPAAALLIAVLLALTAGWLLSGTKSGQYLIVTAPSSSLVDSVNLVTGHGGRLAATGALPNVLIAGSSHADFAASMRRAGAWLAVSVPPIAGCGIPSGLPQEQAR